MARNKIRTHRPGTTRTLCRLSAGAVHVRKSTKAKRPDKSFTIIIINSSNSRHVGRVRRTDSARTRARSARRRNGRAGPAGGTSYGYYLLLLLTRRPPFSLRYTYITLCPRPRARYFVFDPFGGLVRPSSDGSDPSRGVPNDDDPLITRPAVVYTARPLPRR